MQQDGNDTDETTEDNYDSVGDEADASSDASSPDQAKDNLVRRSSRFESGTPSKGGILVRRSKRYQPGFNIEVVDDPEHLKRNNIPCVSCRQHRRRCSHWVRQSGKKRSRKSEVVHSGTITPSGQETSDIATEVEEGLMLTKEAEVSTVEAAVTEQSSMELNEQSTWQSEEQSVQVFSSDTDEFVSCPDQQSSPEAEKAEPRNFNYPSRRNKFGKFMKNNDKMEREKISDKSGKGLNQEPINNSQVEECELEEDWKYKPVCQIGLKADIDQDKTNVNTNKDQTALNVTNNDNNNNDQAAVSVNYNNNNNNNNNETAQKDGTDEIKPGDGKENGECNSEIGNLTMKDSLFDSNEHVKKQESQIKTSSADKNKSSDNTNPVNGNDRTEVKSISGDDCVVYVSVGRQKTLSGNDDRRRLETWIAKKEKEEGNLAENCGDPEEIEASQTSASSADESVILLSQPEETPQQSLNESVIILSDSDSGVSSQESQGLHSSCEFGSEVKQSADDSQMLIKPAEDNQVSVQKVQNEEDHVPKIAGKDEIVQKVENSQCCEQMNEAQPTPNGIENGSEAAQQNRDESSIEISSDKPSDTMSPANRPPLSPYACKIKHKHTPRCKRKHVHYPVCDSPHLHGPGAQFRRSIHKSQKRIPVHVHRPKCLAPHLHGPQPLNGRKVPKQVLTENTGTPEQTSDDTNVEDDPMIAANGEIHVTEAGSGKE